MSAHHSAAPRPVVVPLAKGARGMVRSRVI